MNIFKKGDKVRVVRRVDDGERWGDAWVPSMDARVNDGRVYTISKVLSSSKVYLGELDFNFPTSCLVDGCPALFDEDEVW